MDKKYCYGCGNTRVLVAGIGMCGECYADWLALAPGRAHQPDLGMRKVHA